MGTSSSAVLAEAYYVREVLRADAVVARQPAVPGAVVSDLCTRRRRTNETVRGRERQRSRHHHFCLQAGPKTRAVNRVELGLVCGKRDGENEATARASSAVADSLQESRPIHRRQDLLVTDTWIVERAGLQLTWQQQLPRKEARSIRAYCFCLVAVSRMPLARSPQADVLGQAH
eukprot:scaffold109416_cov33-Tisochrysis_lutea.AAC.11